MRKRCGDARITRAGRRGGGGWGVGGKIGRVNGKCWKTAVALPQARDVDTSFACGGKERNAADDYGTPRLPLSLKRKATTQTKMNTMTEAMQNRESLVLWYLLLSFQRFLRQRNGCSGKTREQSPVEPCGHRASWLSCTCGVLSRSIYGVMAGCTTPINTNTLRGKREQENK
jgi:hypothetical protein